MWEHVFNVNTVSTGFFTETMIPLLEKSKLPKVIFISSSLGSIGGLQKGGPLIPLPYYNSSKSAVNMLAAYYAKKHTNFKVNTVCPGLRATGLSDKTPVNDETHPSLGAIRAVQLATEGPDGVTGTYSDKDGPLLW